MANTNQIKSIQIQNQIQIKFNKSQIKFRHLQSSIRSQLEWTACRFQSEVARQLGLVGQFGQSIGWSRLELDRQVRIVSWDLRVRYKWW